MQLVLKITRKKGINCFGFPFFLAVIMVLKAAIVASMLTHLEEEAGEADSLAALMAEDNPRRQLQIFSEWIRRLFDMSADIFTVVAQSPDEPSLVEIRENGDARRLGGCKMLAGKWAEAGVLNDKYDADAAAELRTRQAELLPQRPEQRGVWLSIDLNGLAVHA